MRSTPPVLDAEFEVIEARPRQPQPPQELPRWRLWLFYAVWTVGMSAVLAFIRHIAPHIQWH